MRKLHCVKRRLEHPLQTGSVSGHRDSRQDRKSTRLNSSHANISYAVFCLKKKKNKVERRAIHDLLVEGSAVIVDREDERRQQNDHDTDDHPDLELQLIPRFILIHRTRSAT